MAEKTVEGFQPVARPICTHRLSKPIPADLELSRLLRESAEQFKAMSPEAREAEIKAQRDSWARQDMD